MLLRSAFRVSCLVVLAALLCLMLPRALSATEGALGSTEGAAVGAAQAPAIRDIGDSPYKAEIEQAVRLGYLSLGGDACFKPDAKIRAKDFLAAIGRGMTQAGMPDGPEITLEDPNGYVSRQQAMKMLVSSIISPEQLDLIRKQCSGPGLYLSDFTDANEVASWAEAYVAAAVFRGWVPDRARLYPKEAATRGFTAALLARAFPDQSAFTGLAVYVCAKNYKRAMTMQVVADDQVLYPVQDGLPSIAYSSAPGIASYCPTLEEAKKRRVGYNPLVVAAERVQRGRRGEVQIIVPSIEAQRIVDASRQGLFLKTWRVAIIEVPSTGIQTAMGTASADTPR